MIVESNVIFLLFDIETLLNGAGIPVKAGHEDGDRGPMAP